jgi:ubiquinone/menaquinone biosynthesis C-methylase UbiE
MTRAQSRNSYTLVDVRAHWNRVAPVYDGWNKAYDSTHFQRFEEGLKHLELQAGQRVLDVWCRTGNASRYIAHACPQACYVGLELAEELLSQARRKYPQQGFIHGEPVSLPFPAATFERVVSLETLEHMPNPGQFLRELRRVLQKGGRLVLSTPPATAEWMTRLVDALGLNHGEGPRRFLPSKEIKRLMDESGFKLLLHRGTLLIPAGPRFLQRWGREWLDERVQGTPLAELGIRQFYVCEAVWTPAS